MERLYGARHGGAVPAAGGRSSSPLPLLDAVLAHPRSLAVSRRIANENLRARQFAASMCNVHLPSGGKHSNAAQRSQGSPVGPGTPPLPAGKPHSLTGVSVATSPARGTNSAGGMSKGTIDAIIDTYVRTLVEEEEAASLGSTMVLRDGDRPTPSPAMSTGPAGGVSVQSVSNAQAKARKYLVAVAERKAPHFMIPLQRPKNDTVVDASHMSTDMREFVSACGLDTTTQQHGAGGGVDDNNNEPHRDDGADGSLPPSRHTPHMYIAHATIVEAERRVKHLLTHVVQLKHAHSTHGTLRNLVEHAIAAGAVPPQSSHGPVKTSAGGPRGDDPSNATVACSSRGTVASPQQTQLVHTSLRLLNAMPTTTDLNRSNVERRTATDGGRSTATATALSAGQRRALSIVARVAMGIAVVHPMMVGEAEGTATAPARSDCIPVQWMAIVGALFPGWFQCACIANASNATALASSSSSRCLPLADWVARVASLSTMWQAASPMHASVRSGNAANSACSAPHTVDAALLRFAQAAVDGTPISSCPVVCGRDPHEKASSSTPALPGTLAEAAAKYSILLERSLDNDAAGSTLRQGKGASLRRLLLAMCGRAMVHSSVGFSLSRMWVLWCPSPDASNRVHHGHEASRPQWLQQLHRCFTATASVERCACATCSGMRSHNNTPEAVAQPSSGPASHPAMHAVGQCFLLASQLDSAFMDHVDAVGVGIGTVPFLSAVNTAVPPALLRSNTAVDGQTLSAVLSATVTPPSPVLAVSTTAEPSIISRLSGGSDGDDLRSSTSGGATSFAISGGHTHHATVLACARARLMQRFATGDRDGDGAWTFFEWVRAVFSASIALLALPTTSGVAGHCDSDGPRGGLQGEAEVLVLSFLAAQWLPPHHHPPGGPSGALSARRQLAAARRVLQFIDDDCDVFGFVLTK